MKTSNFLGVILLSLLTLISSNSMAESHQHFRFQKSFKSFGMGGAGIVQKDSIMGMFANPANLQSFSDEEKLQGELFGTVIGTGDNLTNIISDLQNAVKEGTDVDKNNKIITVLDEYVGENILFGLNVTPIAIAFSSDFFDLNAQGIGLVTSLQGNAKTHSGFGSAGALEINSINYVGLVHSMSKDFDNLWFDRDVTIGMNTKLLRYYVLSKSFTVAELVDKDRDDNVRNNYLEKGTAIVADIGINWELLKRDGWNVKSGFVVANLGGIGNASIHSAYIPTTFDLGLLAEYELTSYSPLTFALDFIDISNAYKDEGDLKKRINYGVDLRVFQSDDIDFGVQAGMHQAEITYGGNLTLFSSINLGYASYSEEVGVFAGQDPARKSIYYFAFSF